MKFPHRISDFRQVIGEGYYFVDRSDQAGLRAAGVGGGLGGAHLIAAGLPLRFHRFAANWDLTQLAPAAILTPLATPLQGSLTKSEYLVIMSGSILLSLLVIVIIELLVVGQERVTAGKLAVHRA